MRVSNFELDGINIPLVLWVLLPEVLGDAVSLILQPYVGQMTILAGDPGVTSEATFASISALICCNVKLGVFESLSFLSFDDSDPEL